MSDIVDELNPDNLRTVDGVCTPTVEVHSEVLRRAIAEIERLRSIADPDRLHGAAEAMCRLLGDNAGADEISRLRSIAGKADAAQSFAEMTKNIPRLSSGGLLETVRAFGPLEEDFPTIDR